MKRADLSPVHVTVSLRATLRRNEQTLDLVELHGVLRELNDSQSILSAATALGTTYRTFWGRLEEYEAALGAPVVEKRRGRGTQLTALGRALLKTLADQLGAQLQPDRALGERLTRALEEVVGGARVPVRLAASHDFAIANALVEETAQPFDVRYTGSAQAVRSLLSGEAEIAGFHSPLGDVPALDPSIQSLKSRAGFRCIPVMEREQGIMVAKGNPFKFKSLADIAKPGVRFVNRQRGSGTRTLLDAMLRSHGIHARSINGYEQEEFTHQAVAAIIAAGGADAGIGLRAAAARFDLEFVSLGWETYYLGAADDTFQLPQARWLIEALSRHCRALVGYRVSNT